MVRNRCDIVSQIVSRIPPFSSPERAEFVREAGVTSGREVELHRLEERLRHRFRDLSLLDRALTHVSRAHEDPERRTPHYEPLEFLGDSVLGFLVAVMLHRRAPEGGEGGKSRLKAHLVSAPSLARRAQALG